MQMPSKMDKIDRNNKIILYKKNGMKFAHSKKKEIFI